MLTDEVTLVDDMARGLGKLGRQIAMAGIAFACLPLVLVRVAAEALCHRRAHGCCVDLASRRVARNALSSELRKVLCMREAEMVARHHGFLAGVPLPVATIARS